MALIDSPSRFTIPKQEQDNFGPGGELSPPLPGIPPQEREPQRPDFEAIDDAQVRARVAKLQSQIKREPRAAMVSVTGFRYQATAGMVNAASRADAFVAAIKEAKELLQDDSTATERSRALTLLRTAHHDFDCAQSEATNRFSTDEDRKNSITAAMTLYGSLGAEFREDLISGVNHNNPGENLRMLEQLNLAAGKEAGDGLDDVYRKIVYTKVPVLATLQEDGPDPAIAAAHQQLKEEVTAFNAAVALFNDKSYSLAQNAFTDFLKEYPESVYSQQAKEAQAECRFIEVGGALDSLGTELQNRIDLVRGTNPSAPLFELVGDKMEWNSKITPIRESIVALRELDSDRCAGLLEKLADIQYHAEIKDSAIELYSQSAAISSNPEYAKYSIAVCYQETRQSQKADEAYAAFCESYPKSARLGEVLVRRAHLALAGEQTDTALTHYVAALESDLSPALREQILHEAGSLAIEHGNGEQGRNLLSMLVKEFPNSEYVDKAKLRIATSSLSDDYARASELAKNPETSAEAITLYAKIAEENKGSEIGQQAQYRQIHLLASSGSWDEIQNLKNSFIAQYPDSPLADEVKEYAAVGLKSQGKLDESIVAYAELLKTYPEHSRADIWKQSIQSLTSAIKNKHFSELTTLFKQKDIEAISEALPSFIEKYPNDTRIDALRYNLAILQANAKQIDEAIRVFRTLDSSADETIRFASQENAVTLAIQASNPKLAQELITTYTNAAKELEATPASIASLTRLSAAERGLLLSQSRESISSGDIDALDEHLARLQSQYPNAIETAQVLSLRANHALKAANNALQEKDSAVSLESYAKSQELFKDALRIYSQDEYKTTHAETIQGLSQTIEALSSQVHSVRTVHALNSFREAVRQGRTENVISQAESLSADESFAMARDEIRFEHAKALHASGKSAEASELFRKLIDESNSIYDPRARIELAHILMDSGQLNQAGVLFAEAAVTRSNDSSSEGLKQQISRCQIEGLFGLAACYKQRGDAELFSKTLETLGAHKELQEEDRTRIAELQSGK